MYEEEEEDIQPDSNGSEKSHESAHREHQMTFRKKSNLAESSIIIPHSPPSFITMRQLTDAANAFYNMSLAHEITVDSEFRIEKYEPPEESLQHTVKETMERAFWDILRDSLESQPPDYGPALRLLDEIKRSLMGLVLPNQKTLQKLVESTFDMEAVRTQLCVTGQLSLDTYAIQVINLMRQFCAPVRDQDVENLRSIDDPVDSFRQAFVVLEKMHMDLANFTITQMRPFIRQEAVVYERAKFAEFLAAQSVMGIDGLKKTRAWINEAYHKLAPVVGNESSSSSQLPSCNSQLASSSSKVVLPLVQDYVQSEQNIPLTPNSILLEAYFSLLTWPTDKPWPETVIMDQHRIVELGYQLTSIITLTSLILVVCNFIASNVAHIFSRQNFIQVPPNAIVELKRLVCQTGIDVLQTVGTVSEIHRADKLSEDIVLSVERWLNIVVARHQGHNVQSDVELTTDILMSAPYGVLESRLHNALVSQIHEIVKADHPVYNLMNRRALTFLRSALSSNPSESLPLPPGFSILSDFTKSTSSTLPGTETTATAPAAACTGSCSQQTVPPMATGLRPSGSTPTSDPLLKLAKSSDQLSLADLVSRLMPVLAHNRHVFGPKYAELIQKLLLPKSPPAKVNHFSSVAYNLHSSDNPDHKTEEEQEEKSTDQQHTEDQSDSDVFRMN